MLTAFEMTLCWGWVGGDDSRMVGNGGPNCCSSEDTANESQSTVLTSISHCWNSLQHDLKNVFLRRTKQINVCFSPRGDLWHIPTCLLNRSHWEIIWESRASSKNLCGHVQKFTNHAEHIDACLTPPQMMNGDGLNRGKRREGKPVSWPSLHARSLGVNSVGVKTQWGWGEEQDIQYPLAQVEMTSPLKSNYRRLAGFLQLLL